MKTLVLAAALCGLATPALAQDWYVKGEYGVSSHDLTDTDLVRRDVYGAAVGYAGLEPFRFELGVRDLEGITRSDALYPAFGAQIASITAYYDLRLGRASAFVGAGGDYLSGESVPLPTNCHAFCTARSFDDFDARGWHADAGVSYRLTSHLTAEAAFRHTEVTGEVTETRRTLLGTFVSTNERDLEFDQVTGALRFAF